jgi:Rrf2 family transcriptional regulator, cysteine metabolism repressor
MELNKKTEYAIAAMVDIAKQGNEKLVASKDIAERQSIPPKFIPQIIHALSKGKLITSIRGAGGGVKLNNKADEINLKQIIELIEGPIQVNFKKKKKGDPKMNETLQKLEETVVKEFEKVTISELSGSGNKKWFW